MSKRAMNMNGANRSKHGLFTIEWMFGLVILVPVMLMVADLCVIYAGISSNDQICREAARNAAGGPPDVVCAKSPFSRAMNVIKRANKGGFFFIDPECEVTEKITAMPAVSTGGPIEGFTNVDTTVTVNPPFLVSGWLGKNALKFTASATFPITYIMSTAKTQLPILPSDDGWLVNISPLRLDRYLNYSGSSIPNLAKMCIFYSKLSETRQPVAVHYEDLLYCGNHAIGCNQFHSFDLTPGTTGVVHITTGSGVILTEAEGYGAGNAVGRLFLDLFEKNCVIRQVIVPLDSYRSVIQGFCSSGFMEESQMPRDTIPKLFLKVVSEPPGQIENVIVP